MDKDTTKSTFMKYLSPLDTEKMLDEIRTLGLDKYTKKLDAITFTQLLVFGQIQQVTSLTNLSGLLNEDPKLQAQLGLASISTSQLSRKLRMETRFLESVFRRCVDQNIQALGWKKATNRLGRMNLVDSSTITMCLSQYPWASFQRDKAGVKLHLRLVFMNERVYPDKATLTPARPADTTQMDELISCDENALFVFDRGYVDYRKFDVYCQSGTKFVTRLRHNAGTMAVLEERPVAENSPVLRDAVIRLGSEFRSMAHPTRRIEALDKEGQRVIFLTNDLTLPAEEICDLYRNRWQIELFFKWIKQHLTVKQLYGKSENAVYNQLRIALITFCLLVLLQARVKHSGRLIAVYKSLQRHWAEKFDTFVFYVTRPPTRRSCGRRRMNHEQTFTQTLQQYVNGDVGHLETSEYDPIFIR
ncbi:IS4 family transposase [Alicyclobacillus sp. SO9]|uniref:IS4 family transposase n=1 Tax=Alicyclobacillus sp. SO9 TaxID=2665646 RepID=UPI0018E7BDD0|nr:IS4 family transposase [Alicyclobacillus sp. SO9]QQE79491.1 IS4 family transposase [Alicyclobacillus sp. SO9]QQE79905.1 IS4 family transposase [Alicyclobacillus sp. SO9]QQE80773.1 IS4 family transposase [Alicyclobacillus sp. SO9]